MKRCSFSRFFAFLINAAVLYNHSSVRKVHLVNGHVVYVYWTDTVYVQNNLPTELSKKIFS